MRDRAWAKRGRSCHRGFLLPFRFPFSGFPPGAQRKGSVVGGTQRAFSSRQAGAGSPGFGAHAGLRAAGGRSRSLSCRRAAVRRVGSNGAGRAVRGGRCLPRPLGGGGAVSLSARPFSLPGPQKARSKRRTTGDETTNETSPFRHKSPHALYKEARAFGQSRLAQSAFSLRHSAMVKPTTEVGFRASPLRRGKADNEGRLWHFATSPC